MTHIGEVTEAQVDAIAVLVASSKPERHDDRNFRSTVRLGLEALVEWGITPAPGWGCFVTLIITAPAPLRMVEIRIERGCFAVASCEFDRVLALAQRANMIAKAIQEILS